MCNWLHLTNVCTKFHINRIKNKGFITLRRGPEKLGEKMVQKIARKTAQKMVQKNSHRLLRRNK